MYKTIVSAARKTQETSITDDMSIGQNSANISENYRWKLNTWCNLEYCVKVVLLPKRKFLQNILRRKTEVDKKVPQRKVITQKNENISKSKYQS